MRLLATALIALATLAWTAPPAEARSREQSQAQSRQAAGPQANRAAATRAAAAPQRNTQPVATRQAAAARPAATGRQATTGRQAATSQGRSQAAGRTDARGTRQVAARSGSRQQAATNCRGSNCGARTRTVSWQAGLEPPTNAQAQSCPVGTMATLARGHSDIVRCMPL